MDHCICPHCGAHFPFRSNKRFCSATCRKLNAQDKVRAKTPANAQQSRWVQRDQMEIFDLGMRMAERLYKTPPDQRLGYINYIVDLARSGESPRTRQVLTMPTLLKPDPTRRSLFWRNCPNTYLTISQAANRFCWHFWNAGVKDVVRGVAPEPSTGEVYDQDEIAA